MEIRIDQTGGMVLSLVNHVRLSRNKRIGSLSLIAFSLFLYTLLSTPNRMLKPVSTTQPVLGKDYVRVGHSEIIETLLPKEQVNVIEFFSYQCEACRLLEADVEKWLSMQPASVRLEQIPMSDGSAVMDQLVRVHYLVHRLKANMTSALFTWFEDVRNVKQTEILKANLLKLGVSLEDYEHVMDQPAGLDAQVNRGKNLEKVYHIQESPIFIVGGCYKTSLAMVDGDVSRLFETIDVLIEKVKQGN